jgi:hypothetical protein
MRLCLRFWRREPWLGSWTPEPKPPPIVTRHPKGGVISFDGRAEPLEIVVAALNASNATGAGRLLSYREGTGEPKR